MPPYALFFSYPFCAVGIYKLLLRRSWLRFMAAPCRAHDNYASKLYFWTLADPIKPIGKGPLWEITYVASSFNFKTRQEKKSVFQICGKRKEREMEILHDVILENEKKKKKRTNLTIKISGSIFHKMWWCLRQFRCLVSQDHFKKNVAKITFGIFRNKKRCINFEKFYKRFCSRSWNIKKNKKHGKLELGGKKNLRQ